MKDSESGYILAATLGALLAISIVAAAIVSASVDTLSSVVRSEAAAKREATLQSAFQVVTTQLSLDPNQRQLELSESFALVTFQQRVEGRISWESDKLDLNLASYEAIDTFLTDAEVDAAEKDQVLTAVEKSRASNSPIRLMSDLGLSRDAEACLSSFVTIFGGRNAYDPATPPSTIVVGQPAAGSRLSISLALEDGGGLSVVVLMTGNRLTPFQILDWRDTVGFRGDRCNVTTNHV